MLQETDPKQFPSSKPLPSMLWEYDSNNTSTYHLPSTDIEKVELPENFRRTKEGSTALNLPEISELELVRHFTKLAGQNFSIDREMYPLGSCTMKYNPRINEKTAGLKGFLSSHPAMVELSEGSIELIYLLQEQLKELSGFPGISLQPAAGAQGELSGVLIMKAFHRDNGNIHKNTILIPDSAHGTNPASVAMVGWNVKTIPSGEDGRVDLIALEEACDENVAGMMLTNPNTLGVFEKNVGKIAELVHGCGGLLYADGANFNAIAGIVRPGDLGFDIMHFNLHKTFATPHGGGGPGAGPVGVVDHLVKYLPGPIAVKIDHAAKGGGNVGYDMKMPDHSIGRVRSFFGNFLILVRAYTYIYLHGRDGIKENSETAVLNANYLKHLVKDILPTAYDSNVLHEFVSSHPKGLEVNAMDIAKRLLDYGFHAPTIHFPLIVKDALMIEPTESEAKARIEEFARVIRKVYQEAKEDPQLVKNAPHMLPRRQIDEVHANRQLKLRHDLSK